MARMEDIRNDIWGDPQFERLASDAKLLYVWSFTNPRCDMAGVYKVSEAAIGRECCLKASAVTSALKTLVGASFVSYDGCWLWVRTRVKHLRQKGEKMAVSVVRDFDRLPLSHPFRNAFLDEYGGVEWIQKALHAKGIDNPSITHRYPTDTPSDPASTQEIREPLDNPSATHPRVAGTGTGTGTTTSSQGEDEVDARTRSKRADQDAPPDSLPAHLRPVAEEALVVLRRTHDERGGNTPTLRGVGLAVAALPDRDHLTVAGELEHWAVAGTGQRRDVRDWAATYRRFLANAPAGAPSRQGAPTSLGDGVRKAAQLRRADEEETRRIVAETQNNQGDPNEQPATP